MNGPKVLLFDIETAPILGYVWSLWENNVALNQIHTDWYILSWAAKWLGSKEVMYQDQRRAPNKEDDKALLTPLWKLLNEADIVVTQNGKQFDSKKLNARFIINGFSPPSPYKHIDTKILAKRHFGFTSNRLEYMTEKLCTKYKKLKHEKFAGFELWRECLAGNPAAWAEMEKYNRHDVLSLEELYQKLQPWDSQVNFNLYRKDTNQKCNCGSSDLQRRGYSYTGAGKWQRFECQNCGAWSRGAENLLSKKQREKLRRNAT